MKRPRTARIDGRIYSILYKRRNDLVSTYRGRIFHAELRITVAKDQPLESQKETLFHELLHSASQNTGHPLEENATEGIANSLFAILRDNPKVARWLLK